MPMCFFGRLVDQLNKGISFRNLKDRFTDRRAVVRRDPNSAAIRLQVKGDTGIQALAFNGELALCCHRAITTGALLWLEDCDGRWGISVASPAALWGHVRSRQGRARPAADHV